MRFLVRAVNNAAVRGDSVRREEGNVRKHALERALRRAAYQAVRIVLADYAARTMNGYVGLGKQAYYFYIVRNNGYILVVTKIKREEIGRGGLVEKYNVSLLYKR